MNIIPCALCALNFHLACVIHRIIGYGSAWRSLQDATENYLPQETSLFTDRSWQRSEHPLASIMHAPSVMKAAT